MNGMAHKLAGTTKGPGDTPHEFIFISTDPENILKHGEYVWYAIEKNNKTQRVIARITERVDAHGYPDTFLSDPLIAPQDIAAIMGYPREQSTIYEISAAIMGYFDTDVGAFINPWIPPLPGSPVFFADSAMLAEALSRKRQNDIGSAWIGDLLTREPGDAPIIIDMTEITSSHLAVIASTGSGKSYLAGVLIEELMRPYNRASVLIIDPHGEYSTLQELTDLAEFRAAAEQQRTAYQPEVRIFKPAEVKVRLSTLEIGDLRYLLPDMTEKQQYLLEKGFKKMTADPRLKKKWTGRDLIQAISENAGGENERDDTSTVGALEWKIEARFIENTLTFDPVDHLDLRDIFKPGQCSVLPLHELDDRNQQVVAATLLRRAFRARERSVQKKEPTDGDQNLDYPIFILIEEAHHFAPAKADVISLRILKQILAEGRKFGMGIGLISQRPGKLDADVLSQCQTQCIMRIVNEVDQNAVAASVESVGHELLQNLPALSKGQVIISGAAVNTPVLCRVRKRVTKHGGASIDAPMNWVESFNARTAAEQRRNEATSAPPSNTMGIYRKRPTP